MYPLCFVVHKYNVTVYVQLSQTGTGNQVCGDHKKTIELNTELIAEREQVY